MTARPFIRFRGRWDALSARDREALVRRQPRATDDARARAEAIVNDVRARGDSALFELAMELDGVTLDVLEVPRRAVTAALTALEPSVRRALERAAGNIASVHSTFAPAARAASPEPGITIIRRPDPLRRVGIYAPGGRASYPSSVLMGAIPARVAGVAEIVLACPPDRSGAPPAPMLAAAALAKVDRVFAIGGAGAIAAMAIGTESVPRVERIVGPGNAYVSAAKLLVCGEVAIDCPAGPSELLVIADGGSDVRAVAAEMVAQAEHDPCAWVAALVVGDGVAAALCRALENAVMSTPRASIVREVLAARGGVFVVRDADEAVAIANEMSAEHLLLAVDQPERLIDAVRNAGSVFVGVTSSVAFGDYLTGANHVLPTGGTARSYSGLSTVDFVRWTTFQLVDREAACRLSTDAAAFARAEGLPAHAAAALRWSAAS